MLSLAKHTTTPTRTLPANCLYRGDIPPRTPILDGRIYNPIEVYAEDQPVNEQVIYRAMLRESLAFYAVEKIMGPDEAPYNGKFIAGKHHLEWDSQIATKLRISIQAARDHGKSMYWTQAFPIWKGDINDPGKEIYVFSATQTLAQEQLERTKFQLENNPKLDHLVPPTSGKGTTWSKREIKLTTGTIIRARGWNVKVRGGHPPYIIVDDPLTDEVMYSETVRLKSNEYFFNVISNMVTPTGQVVICGTPMHFADLHAKVKETRKYYCSKFPALDKYGNALFPERYDKKSLKDKEEEITSLRFAREFLLRPLTDELSLFPMELFEGNDIRMPYRLGLPAKFWEDKGMDRYTGMDIALSASVGADYTCIFTVAVDEQANRWIVNIRRGRGWPYQKQLQELKEEYVLMQPSSIHIEANQAQRIIPDELMLSTDMPIRRFFTTGKQPKKYWERGMSRIVMGKHDLDKGVPSLRLSLEQKKWRIPRGDSHSIEMTDIWIGEMNCISYTTDKGVVSVGEHDDSVMASWMSDVAAKLGGSSFYTGDEDDEESTMFEYPQNGSGIYVSTKFRNGDLNLPHLIQTLQQLPNSGKVYGLKDAEDKIIIEDNCYIVWVENGDANFLKFAMEQQGYAEVVGFVHEDTFDPFGINEEY